MKRAALALLLFSTAAHAQSQGWTADQNTQGFLIQAPDSLGVDPTTVIADRLIVINDNSGAAYNVVRCEGSGLCRLWSSGNDLIVGADVGLRINLAANGITHASLNTNGDFYSGLAGGNLAAHGLSGPTDGTGFLLVGTSHGPPTSVPGCVTNSGAVCETPLDFDDLNNIWYYYNNPAAAWQAFATGAGTVTSVAGTAGRITVTPSSPNPVVDLATFGSSPTCAWANVVVDAWGRTTCTANTAPQPAGNYITALTHDVIATGPGSVSAEVIGVTDGTSVDHPVAAGAWTNGQALALDGSAAIHTVPFQAPLTACTDYVSVSCQGGTSDIGTTGSNSAVPVIGIENAGAVRGQLNVTEVSAPVLAPAAGTVYAWADSTFPQGGIWAEDSTGSITHGMKTQTCAASTWVRQSLNGGGFTCGGVAVSDLSGNLAGDTHGPPTATVTDHITESSGPASLAIGAIPVSSTDAQVLLRPQGGAATVVGVGASLINNRTKRDYLLQASVSPSITDCGMAAGGNGFLAGCGFVEYPNEFQAGHIQLTAYMPTNAITGGTLSFEATLNGAPISGTQFSFTSGTSPGEAVISVQPTGSGSASDTIGFGFTTSIGYTGGFENITFHIVLTP